MTLAVKPELGRGKWRFLFTGSRHISFQNSCYRRNMFKHTTQQHWKASQKNLKIRWREQGRRSSHRLGRSTMQFSRGKQILAGANFCGRSGVNSSVKPPFPPSYLLFSKAMCSDKGAGFVFTKRESETTLKKTGSPATHTCTQARSTRGCAESSSPGLQSDREVEKSSTRRCLSTVPHVLSGSLPQARVRSWLRCPRNDPSQKGFVPIVAMDYWAPLAPKLPPPSTAWSLCHKGHMVPGRVDACLTGGKLWAKLGPGQTCSVRWPMSVWQGDKGRRFSTAQRDLVNAVWTTWKFFLCFKAKRVGPRLAYQSIEYCRLDCSPWHHCNWQMHTSIKWVQVKSQFNDGAKHSRCTFTAVLHFQLQYV